MSLKNLFEAKDVTVYKRLIRAFGDYTKSYPFTGVDVLFKKAVDKGKSVLPKDKRALDILDHLLSASTSSSAVQKVLNTRFSYLPIDVRPLIKVDIRNEVAFWQTADDRVSDRVNDLINLEGKKGGGWVNVKGEKVSLIDMNVKEGKVPDDPATDSEPVLIKKLTEEETK